MSKKTLSENQTLFVADAHNQGLVIDYGYSGRGMYGETCPAVRCMAGKFSTKADFSTDQMGMRTVFYART